MSKKTATTLKLTTRGKHAVIALVELEDQYKGKPVPLSVIGDAVDISISYLEQLFSCMRRDGIVKSFRGPGGGYALARPAEDITIASILITAESCLQRNDKKSDFNQSKKLENLWSQLGTVMHDHLSNISLKDVCSDNDNTNGNSEAGFVRTAAG